MSAKLEYRKVTAKCGSGELVQNRDPESAKLESRKVIAKLKLRKVSAKSGPGKYVQSRDPESKFKIGTR